MAVVRAAVTLVDVLAGDAIVPAPRAESTVSREASRSDPAVLRGVGMLPLSGLLATCAENQRALLTERGWVRPGSRPRLGLLFKGNSKTVREEVPCFRL